MQKKYWRSLWRRDDLIEAMDGNRWIREYVAQYEKWEWQAKMAKLPSIILLPSHVEICKRRGGCCANDCECCTHPRARTSYEGDVYFHCTVYCTCCIRRRGFVDPRKFDLADWVSETDFGIEIPNIGPSGDRIWEDESDLESATTPIHDRERDRLLSE